MRSDVPTLIVLGGFAGTGKTFLSQRLSSELGIPRLGSDTIGRTIRNSKGISADADAYWIAYDVLFTLCEEFVQAGISVILDVNMGWAFQWRQLDVITSHHPDVLFLPVVLRCSREICIKRITERYTVDPHYYDPPDRFTSDLKLLKVWNFLDQLDRSDVHFVDASRPQDEVYEEVKDYLAIQIK